jgi:hypothetical protein
LRAAALFSIATASQELLPPASSKYLVAHETSSLLPPKTVTGFAKTATVAAKPQPATTTPCCYPAHNLKPIDMTNQFYWGLDQNL